MKFVTSLAWIFGSLSLFIIICRIVATANYVKAEKQLDAFRGVEKSWPIVNQLIILIICVTWLIYYW